MAHDAKSFLTLTQDELEQTVVMCEQAEETAAKLKETSHQLENRTKEVEVLADKVRDSEHKHAVLEQQVAVLTAQVGSAGQIQTFSAPITEEGKAGSIPFLDASYAVPKWVGETLAHLLTDEALPVVALTGPAGIGKTHGAEQWCARNKRRTVLLNCKGQDPYAFIESQELRDGHTTRIQGILTEAVQSPDTIIILDEIDTSPAEFQALLFGMLEVEPHRRKITTQGNGVIRVAQGVRFILTMNNIGMNCGSRHRGSVLPPIQNRVSGCAGWIQVPMPEEGDLIRILLGKNPTMAADMVRKVAKATLQLIKASADGLIDCDVSIRTGLGVCKALPRFGVKGAWGLGLLDGIDDPTQKAAAVTAICAHFPTDFKPVGK